MNGFLRTEVIGNVGKDAVLGQTNGGTAVAALKTVVGAVNETFKSNDEKKERTTWIKVVIYGKRAEALAPYIKTGGKVFAAGRIASESWLSDEGEAKSSLVLTLGDGRQDFNFLSGLTESEAERVAETDEEAVEPLYQE